MCKHEYSYYVLLFLFSWLRAASPVDHVSPESAQLGPSSSKNATFFIVFQSTSPFEDH